MSSPKRCDAMKGLRGSVIRRKKLLQSLPEKHRVSGRRGIRALFAHSCVHDLNGLCSRRRGDSEDRCIAHNIGNGL